VHPAHTVIDGGVYVAHGAFATKPVPTDALRGHILAHVMANDPAREQEWDEWYDREHIPDMMASEAFSAPRRGGGGRLAARSARTSSRCTTSRSIPSTKRSRGPRR
jgi:hypothetical protein